MVERKLTAILCADVFGYSRLMGENEEATLRTLSSHRKLIDSLIEQHHGRFVNSAGDSVLAEFASVVNAVQCAVDIQSTLKAENANLPPERRMEFRIGVNLGDVMVDGEQIYGDGVNVAARLESLADPSGICVSAKVHDEIRSKLALTYEDLGAQSVKNISEPVRVYRVLAEAGAATPRKTQKVARRYLWRGAFSLVGLAIIVGTIVLVQHLSLRPPTITASIPPTQTPALTLPDKPSIAVLPFANMSDDPKQEYFSDGITDDLTTALSRLPDLFVIARTSAFTYKGKAAKVQDIGRELGVAYVLEGSVRKADNQVRITAQLVDATTGDHLWAEHYDRPMRDIFALQDELVRRIVTTLNLQLTLSQQGVVPRRGTENIEAYDDFLRGMEYVALGKGTSDDFKKAREMFEKAIALDPMYADAYASLGLIYYGEWLRQWSQDPHALERASELAQKAIALDDSNPPAYALLSRLDLANGQYDRAIADARRAITLNPNAPIGYSYLASALTRSGKPVEAIGLLEKATRLDPRNGDVYLQQVGFAYTATGRYQEAVPVLKRALARIPNWLEGYQLLVVADSELGNEQEARAEAAEVVRLSPGYSLETAKQRLGPWKDPAYEQRFFSDLRKAGLK